MIFDSANAPRFVTEFFAVETRLFVALTYDSSFEVENEVVINIMCPMWCLQLKFSGSAKVPVCIERFYYVPLHFVLQINYVSEAIV